jgi:pimeloyl-ACP methyl ester carboxylesterase
MGLNIVLIHGFLSGPIQWRFPNNIEEYLSDANHSVLNVNLAARGTIEYRTKQLVAQIKAWDKGGRPLHLIGHSMGGLNAREVAANKEAYNLDIRTVTTFATPHFGSTLAAIKEVPVVGFFAELASFVIGGDADPINTFSAEESNKFNRKTPNHSNVLYLSWAAKHDYAVSGDSDQWGYYLGACDAAHITATTFKWTYDETLPILKDWEESDKVPTTTRLIEDVQAGNGIRRGTFISA